MRRENAQGLRREAAAQGVDTRELDRAIKGLRQLDNSRAFGDPKGIAQLQTAMLERLKNFEFVPYRALVEEYYRVRAESKRRP